ncbi:MAG TPA: hypothetical protein DCZ91_22245 [Lachnospiraceae bacterium]|nr:hypothetical protein [Lachnospiraceae bacterium]
MTASEGGSNCFLDFGHIGSGGIEFMKGKSFLRKKKLLVLFLVLLGLGGSAIRFADKQGRIFRFVKKNANELEKVAVSCLGGNNSVEYYQGIKVEGLYEGGHDIVEFSSGGFGIVPSSTYYGFYYSPEDVPVATAFFMNCDGYSLVSEEKDEGAWF